MLRIIAGKRHPVKAASLRREKVRTAQQSRGNRLLTWQRLVFSFPSVQRQLEERRKWYLECG
jgi:hypothetical protein